MDLEYKLSEPVEYHSNGQVEEAEFLVLSAPKGKKLRSALREVRFYVNKAFMTIAKMEQPKSSGDTADADDMPEDEALAALLEYAFQNGDFEDLENFLNAFGQLVTGGICRLSGNEVLRSGTWDNIEEQEQIAYRYCAFFGIGYLEKMRTISEKPSE